MEIIPAIDLIDGKCVRLTQGDYSSKKEYHSDPLEVAKSFEQKGVRRLHLVDLDGAKAKKVINLPVLERIAKNTKLIVDFGGGVRSDEDLEKVFGAGAQQVTCGSVAVKNPDLADKWINKYGADKLILGADVKNEMIAVSGWEENTNVEIIPFLQRYFEMGFRKVICTDISKDGLLQGPSTELYQKIIAAFPGLDLIASGGVTTFEDVLNMKEIGAYGAIIGKAIYEGTLNLEEILAID